MTTNKALQALQTETNKANSLSLRNRSYAIATAGKDNILLLDTSGSMAESVNDYSSSVETEETEETELARIDVLWSIVQDLRSQGLLFRICEFNNYPVWSDGATLPLPSGGTALHLALQFVAEVKPLQVTLITDGFPDNPALAFNYVQKLNCKLNVMYVGPSNNGSAIDFCKELARLGNGSYGQNDLSTEQLQLEANVATRRLLLTEAQPTADKKTINL